MIYLYEKMPATDRRLAAPLASALRPMGPAATETLPPSVMLPVWANVLTALESFNITATQSTRCVAGRGGEMEVRDDILTKSVSSAPSWLPNPAL